MLYQVHLCYGYFHVYSSCLYRLKTFRLGIILVERKLGENFPHK